MPRPKMTEIEKARAAVARTYQRFQATLSEEFAQEVENRHIQFVETNQRMGRPPKTLKELRKQAKARHDDAWTAYARECEKQNEEPDDYTDVVASKKGGNPGRPKKDNIHRLMKYIRSQESMLYDAEHTPESEYLKQARQSHGRPAMSKTEKVYYYEQKIEKARKELRHMLLNLSTKDHVKYKLHELKTKRRQLRILLNDPKNPQVSRLQLSVPMAKLKLDGAEKRIHLCEQYLSGKFKERSEGEILAYLESLEIKNELDALLLPSALKREARRKMQDEEEMQKHANVA